MVVFDPVKDIHSLEGKIILVTGGNAGIGAEFVKALAAHNPACIYLCARKIPAAQALIDTTLEHIRKCAEKFSSKSDRLDLLFLNAGIAGSLPGLTAEGFEIHFGVNHVGHALLTQLLMPTLLATSKLADSDVRVMVTSGSAAQELAPKGGLRLKEMKSTGESMSAMTLSGHSKLANILFARKLGQLYPGITTTSHHPGTVSTEIWSRLDGAGTLVNILAKPILWFTAITPERGAYSGLWTAVVEKGSLKNGAYYEPVGLHKERSKNASSQKLVDDLWEWTNKELADLGGPGWPKV